MSGAFDLVLERLKSGERLRTPDDRQGKPFVLEFLGPEGATVRTSRGGRVRVSPFTFDAAAKYLGDLGYEGDRWLPASDEGFQMLLNAENDRVRAASYVLAILAAARVLDVDGSRPNRVRVAGPSPPPPPPVA